MGIHIIRRWRQATLLVLAICLSALSGTALADESGRASLGIRDVVLKAFSLNGNNPIPLPAPSVQERLLSSTAWGPPTPLTDTFEDSGAQPASTEVRLASGEGTSIFMYDMFNADLLANLTSASVPYLTVDSYFRSFLNITLPASSGLTISGRVFGDVMRATTSTIPGSSTTSGSSFDVFVFGYPENEIPMWRFSEFTVDGELTFDEGFSVTAYNRGTSPLLVSVTVLGRTTVMAAPRTPIPEPQPGYMLATGLVLLLILRRKR